MERDEHLFGLSCARGRGPFRRGRFTTVFYQDCTPGPSGAKEGRAPGVPWDALMILVTGGAGFIGSNVVASLNEAGRTDVAVSDWLGSDGKWRNLQKRQLADMVGAGRPVPLARRAQARRRDPSRRDLGHDRDRRRRRDGQQFPPVAAPARLVHRDAHAVHLCIVGRDLRRRRGRAFPTTGRSRRSSASSR